MSTALRTSLNNARRIIQCTQEILASGVSERCAACSVGNCRQQLARYLPPAKVDLRQ